jgi:hypothetical protein
MLFHDRSNQCLALQSFFKKIRAAAAWDGTGALALTFGDANESALAPQCGYRLITLEL